MYKIVDGCFDWEVVDSQMYKIVDGCFDDLNLFYCS